MIKPINYQIKPNKIIKFATNMTKAGVYLPIILLEGTVVSGRTYQAYKRGGITEARERVLEETTGSFVWLGGAPLLCKLGNKLGKSVGGIKDTDFDIGKDTLRNPLKNVLEKTKGATMGRYAGFKFANTLLSVFVAAGFLGFIVPKLNQKLTKTLNKQKQQTNVQTTNNTEQNTQTNSKELTTKQNQKEFNNIEKFIKTNKQNSNRNINFKGLLSPEQVATITHKLENDAVCKLFSTDAVVVAGRGSNARNSDECREILFRDIVSSFFYLLASPLVIKGLTAIDNKSVKGNTNVNPYSAMQIHNFLIEKLPKEKMSCEEFRSNILGEFNEKEFKKLEFDKTDIITIDKFKELIKDKSLQEKAVEMSKLQPLKDGASVLTKEQAKLVMTNGQITDPKFLKTVLNSIYGPLDGKTDVLANPNKFISRKDIERSTQHIFDYTNSILEYAKKRNISDITPETLLKVNKRNLNHRLGFMIAGFGTAALFLSTIIPKVQYYITKLKTGSDKFPGAKNLEQ